MMLCGVVGDFSDHNQTDVSSDAGRSPRSIDSARSPLPIATLSLTESSEAHTPRLADMQIQQTHSLFDDGSLISSSHTQPATPVGAYTHAHPGHSRSASQHASVRECLAFPLLPSSHMLCSLQDPRSSFKKKNFPRSHSHDGYQDISTTKRKHYKGRRDSRSSNKSSRSGENSDGPRSQSINAKTKPGGGLLNPHLWNVNARIAPFRATLTFTERYTAQPEIIFDGKRVDPTKCDFHSKSVIIEIPEPSPAPKPLGTLTEVDIELRVQGTYYLLTLSIEPSELCL